MDVLKTTLDTFKSMTEEEYPRTADTVFNSVVIVPTDEIHDSGYTCMKFVLLYKDEVVGVCGGYSDVVHINGIGGYGEMKGRLPQLIRPVGWKIDCLPCGLLRLFCERKLKTEEWIGSDFPVYATDVFKYNG